jgi:hypothetical protein
MMGMNILAAKAKKCILNVAPAGCGKSTVTNALARSLEGDCLAYSSLTTVGLMRLQKELSGSHNHVIVDDLGGEKSNWTRIQTLTTLAMLSYSHFVDRSTATGRIQIEDFTGGVSLNIQPVAMAMLVQDEQWKSIVEDKVIRYYHLFRPVKEVRTVPDVDVEWGGIIERVKLPSTRGKWWYQLMEIGKLQWSRGRRQEHISDLLRACAIIDGRQEVNTSDMRLLYKLLLTAQLEPFIITSYGFETGRAFNHNLYCILVELATYGQPSVEQFCEDYHISYKTALNLIGDEKPWCWLKTNSPSRVLPTDDSKSFLDKAGVYEKW